MNELDNLGGCWIGGEMTNKPVSADELLELVFWHGQGNQYPEQNRQPGTSVAEAKRLLAEAIRHIIGEDGEVTGHQRPQGYLNVDLTQSYYNQLRSEQRKRLAEWLGESR